MFASCGLRTISDITSQIMISENCFFLETIVGLSMLSQMEVQKNQGQ